MNMNYASSCRKSRVRSVLARILFYGLFLTGPSLLSESHAAYVQMKIAAMDVSDSDARAKIQRKWRTKEQALKWSGIGCCGIWMIWFLCALSRQFVSRMDETVRRS